MNFDKKTLKSYSNIKSNKSQSAPLLSRGFTIVELLIVVVVIAILAAITIVAFNGVTRQAEDSAMQSSLRTAANKIAVWHVNNDAYPSIAEADLGADNDNFTLEYFLGSSGDSYCIEASNDTASFYIASDTGTVEEGDCEGSVANQPETCPAGFVPVPGDSRFGTQGGFCVMKYEAKKVGNNTGTGSYNSSWVPESRASGTPWVSISQVQAIAESQTVCDGCHLITEAEWMTIAANVLSVASNWSTGTVGSGYIFNGHVNNNPTAIIAASTDDSDGLFGMTGGTGDGPDYNNRRTLSLTNGEVIWDLSGNVWEWTDATINTSTANGEWNNANTQLSDIPELSRPSAISAEAATWGRGQGIGQLFGSSSTSTRGFSRGGWHNFNSNAGILSLIVDRATTSVNGSLGFRVSV